MTRSVTIVNTSNWEHEDYLVRRRRSDFDGGSTGAGEDTVLKPGEKMQFTPGRETIVILGVEDKTPIPFKDADGNQDWPKVEVHKPKPSEPEAEAAA